MRRLHSRRLVVCGIVVYIFLLVANPARAREAALVPDVLRCEQIVNPLGIATAEPVFGWTLTSKGRNKTQSAYEILVSDKINLLQQEKGNVWNTGKVRSSRNTYISYEGSPLQSFKRYFWSIRVYDENDQPSPWSDPAWFETAMLDDADWKAVWIGDGSKPFQRDEDFYQDDRMPLFRKAFQTRKASVASARLYISGVGYYEAYINGMRVGDHHLDPGWTTYSKEVFYVVHDVTPMIRPGNNVTGIMLGNGWYNPLPMRLFGRFNLRDVQETGRPCVKAQLRIQYSDGAIETIVTDDTWMTAPGPVYRNNVYLGEHYDARLEQRDWNVEGSPGKDWRKAVAVKGPTGRLSVQLQPPVRITKVIRPVKINHRGDGIFIADMGRNFAGVVRIRVRGKAGTRITLRYGEALHDDGSLNFLTTVAGQIKAIWNLSGGPGAPATAWQEDSYILKGSGEEVWSPRFTFHGFRYVEITGWPGVPGLQSIEGLRMNSDLEKVGEFSCSNMMFNRLHEAIQWTFLSNVLSVQSDCPGREKMGYGADMVTTANAFIYNYDMHHFYRKAVADFANEQRPEGGITETAPYTGIADKGLGDQSGPLGWQLAFPYLQKQLYEYYGDKRVISEYYPAFVKQMAFLQEKAIDGLFHWDISDHEALDPRPEAFSAAAFYYHHALLAASFAGILAHTEDSTRYTKLANGIRERIVRKYHVPKTGRFDNATQSAQLFSVWYDLSPEKEASLKVLMDEFRRHNFHVSSGIFGVMMMWDVLRVNELNDIAYRIANQRDFPGWGYMLERGATTLWESWEYPDNAPSQNHPMFGSIDEWFYRSLLGINPAAPGFSRIIIKPQPAGDLTSAQGSYRSIQGKISSAWTMEGSAFRLNVSVPPNTKAEIWIPSAGSQSVMESGVPAHTSNGIKFLKDEGRYSVFEAGSGNFSFSSVYPK